MIYAVLHRYPVFESYQDPLKQLLQYEHTLQWWDWNIDEYNKRIDECDAETGNYLSDMMDAISRYFKLEPAFLDEILDICKQPEVMELPHRRRREAVNGLRRMFASISLDRLKPDLVIMDEFQRFKDLIAGDNSESGMLARKFLIEDNDVKVLLLSATPYKPYSTLEELSETGEGHYQEFMQVMDFLMNDDQKKHQFHQVFMRGLQLYNLATKVEPTHKEVSAVTTSQCKLKPTSMPPADKQEWKAIRKIPDWAAAPNQNNHRIIRAFLQLQKERGFVCRPELEARCQDPEGHADVYVRDFRGNFTSMKTDAGKSHGKVFRDDGYNITICTEVLATLEQYRSLFEA